MQEWDELIRQLAEYPDYTKNGWQPLGLLAEFKKQIDYYENAAICWGAVHRSGYLPLMACMPKILATPREIMEMARIAAVEKYVRGGRNMFNSDI